MDLSFLDNAGEQGCRDYIEFLLWHYKVMDAFWFIRIEEERGLAEAERINELVWGKISQLAARAIKQRFNITQKGLQGLKAALPYFPWSALVEYEIQERGDELVLEIPSCPAQEGRKKYGKGEYACKAMHWAEFSRFAEEIDPDIEVLCDFAPPDPHPEGLYCRWRFRAKRS